VRAGRPAAESAAEAFGPSWDDVFTLAECDLLTAEVPEEGRRHFPRPTVDAEVLPPEWTD
jgi:hypothetical protein